MRLTRKEGQQVEVEGLLTQLSIGMTVFITADGEGPVTVKELNVRKWTSGRRFLDEIEKVEDGEAKAEGSPAGPDGALMKDSPVQQLLQAR